MGSHLDTPQWGAFELKMLRRREERLRRRARQRRLVAVALLAGAATSAATFAALRSIRTPQLRDQEAVYADVDALARSTPPPVAPPAMKSLPVADAERYVSRAELEMPLPDSAPTPVAAEARPPPAPALGAPVLSGPAALSEPTSSFALPISTVPAEPSPLPATQEPTRFDAGEVRRAIDAYRDAYQRLDADAARAIWPSVDAGALARAFRDLASQRVDFDGCVVSGEADTAQATCTGRTTYVPRVGGGDAVIAAHEWRFRLRRGGGGWVIDSADVR